MYLPTQSRVDEKATAVVAHPAMKNGLRIFAPMVVIRSAFPGSSLRVYQYRKYTEHAAWSSWYYIWVDAGKPRLSKGPIAWLEGSDEVIMQPKMKLST